MKKLLFFIVLLFISCEKEVKVEYKDQCWICTEKENTKVVRTFRTCDVLEASHQDGRRWVTSVVLSPVPNYVTRATLHEIDCEEE